MLSNYVNEKNDVNTPYELYEGLVKAVDSTPSKVNRTILYIHINRVFEKNRGSFKFPGINSYRSFQFRNNTVTARNNTPIGSGLVKEGACSMALESIRPTTTPEQKPNIGQLTGVEWVSRYHKQRSLPQKQYESRPSREQFQDTDEWSSLQAKENVVYECPMCVDGVFLNETSLDAHVASTHRGSTNAKDYAKLAFHKLSTTGATAFHETRNVYIDSEREGSFSDQVTAVLVGGWARKPKRRPTLLTSEINSKLEEWFDIGAQTGTKMDKKVARDRLQKELKLRDRMTPDLKAIKGVWQRRARKIAAQLALLPIQKAVASAIDDGTIEIDLQADGLEKKSPMSTVDSDQKKEVRTITIDSQADGKEENSPTVEEKMSDECHADLSGDNESSSPLPLNTKQTPTRMHRGGRRRPSLTNARAGESVSVPPPPTRSRGTKRRRSGTTQARSSKRSRTSRSAHGLKG